MIPAPASLAEACGCDTAPAGRLLPVDVALARGLALAEPDTRVEHVPLGLAAGRVLAGDATSPLPMPPFDNAAMDGYAIRRRDLAGQGPWRLAVAGRIAAGEEGAAPPPGHALRILTGAPVPAGLDAVIMQERVTREGGTVVLDRRPGPGENIRRSGEDRPAGARVLRDGALIGPREASALAACGMGTVPVRPRLRVAFFSTGSELVPPGAPLGPGQIWNANRAMLAAALSAPWIEARDMGAVPDAPSALAALLAEACAEADLVISTGGVSVGDEDHMIRLFREAGGEIRAMKVAMKPGKPLAVGRLGRAIYLGLPGNPVAAHVTWQVIGAQIARRRAGHAHLAPPQVPAVADFALERRPGRCEFRPAVFAGRDGLGRQAVRLLTESWSARIGSLAEADGLALIPGEATAIAPGDLLEVIPFDTGTAS